MIPLDPSTPSKKEDLELSRITIREIENQLVSVGFSDNEAKLWSKNSGGTLTILRRLISGPHLPEWAYKNQNQIRQILPIMFVQSWKTEYSGDKEMISKLAKTEYSDYNSFLTEILHYSDRPIHRIGNMWFTYSVLDCYLSFMSYTTKDDWNLFRDVVIEVLSERNPELDLESQNRVFSAIYGKNRKYSEELRKGLAQSLILLAIYGKHSGNDSLHDHAGYVDQIVENIFLIADKDLWYSLGDVMPLLAEASPTKFIRAVEASLSSKEKYIMNMFDEAQVTLFSKDIHYNLLWALQALAWDKRFFKRVVMALCQLSELEPGKDAFNNLTSIFCLWIPQTETSMDERFDVLADIQKTYPAIGWKLLMTLLPSSNDFGTYTSRYKWRELSCPPRPDISQIQFEESIYKTIELAYSYHDNSALSWVQIFDHYDNLPVSCKRMIAEQFKTKVSELIDPEHIVAEKLRNIISKHRTYKSAKWALPEAEIKYLEDLYKQVEPDSALAKYKYLFADFFPDLLEGRKNYQENPEYINQLRTETLKEIIAEIGFTGIIKFSKKPEYQHILASAIPINLISENIDLILETLDSKNKKEVCFCQHLLGTGEKEFGENWAQKLINKAIKDDWAPNKLIKLMLGFSSKRWIWNLLEKMPAEIQTNYWEKTSVAYHDMDSEDTQYMIQKLCESFRNYSALNLAFHSRHSLSIYTIIQVLKTTATTKCCEDAYGNVSYYIEKLLEVVQKAPDIDLETIITLEFHYIPIITSSHSSVRPKYLHQYMSDNPQAFIDMLYMFYKPKQKDEFQNIEDHNKEIIDEQNKRIAKNAFNVLQTWNVIPGSSPQGDIDAAKLINWIDSVINLASEKDILVFALNKIGNVLSFSPKGEGNQWPCDSVCEVIEHYKNEKIDLGFQIEVYNQRGLISKEVFEGGIQERQIAASYKNYSSTVRNRYPWVSDILNNIANSYDNEAKSEDLRAEVDKIRYE